jgi:DNA modification methylase
METLGVDFGKSEGDPDAVPEAPVVPTSKLGDVWLLGKHRVMCGSADSDDVQTVMGGRKADLLLTDPPYGVSYADKNAFLNAISPGNRIQKEIANDHRRPEEMNEFWTTVLSNAHAACSNKASYYIFSPQAPANDLHIILQTSLKSAKWQLKHMLVWVKNNHVLGRCDYHYKHEPVFFGWKEDGTHEFFGGSSCFSVLNFDKPMKNDLHPTMKPLELCAYLIKNSTREGGLVLDLFLGSGSTLIASEQTGRACCGTELDPAYVDVIVRRWQDFTGQAATLDGDGRTFVEIAEVRRA